MSLTKFYYYNIRFEGENGRRLDPRDVLIDDVFSSDIYQISNGEDRNYRTQFRETDSGKHHGIMPC